MRTFGVGTKVVYEIRGQVKGGPSTNGNLTLEWAQNSNNATPTTLYKDGSVMVLREDGT